LVNMSTHAKSILSRPTIPIRVIGKGTHA